MLIDTHAHLFWDAYKENFNSVLQKCVDSGVKTIVNVGTTVEESQVCLDLQANNQEITFFSTIGIHPHEAIKFPLDNPLLLDKAIDNLEEIYQKNPQKVIAVGECGLDYYFGADDSFLTPPLTKKEVKSLQKKLLVAQVKLAKKLNLPLSIHCRDAFEDIFPLIENHFGVLHCFSGDIQIAQAALQINFLISFAATLTYPKNEHLRKVVKTIPLEKILLETDCPFLPPQNRRGQTNDPSTVKEIAELIAELRSLSLQEVAEQTAQNFQQLFGRQISR